mgnify:CR=1 FL=1
MTYQLVGWKKYVCCVQKGCFGLETRVIIKISTHPRECVRAGAAGSRTRRSLGHHLLHPLILRLLVLCAPGGFEA